MIFPFGTIVYHVANSEVPGVVVSTSPDGSTSRVIFREPVGFSGNPLRGLHTDWGCSTNLLRLTADEAHRDDAFKGDKKRRDDEFIAELGKIAEKVTGLTAKKRGSKVFRQKSDKKG